MEGRPKPAKLWPLYLLDVLCTIQEVSNTLVQFSKNLIALLESNTSMESTEKNL